MDSKEYRKKDPMLDQTGKEYTQKTAKGKEIAKILTGFCCLSKFHAMTMWSALVCLQSTHWLISVKSIGRMPSSSGRTATTVRMAWRMHLSYPRNNQTRSGIQHWLAVITKKYPGPSHIPVFMQHNTDLYDSLVQKLTLCTKLLADGALRAHQDIPQTYRSII